MTHCPQTGKVCYLSESKAKRARRQIASRLRRTGSKRRPWESDPYICRDCGYWHLASSG